MLWKEGIRGGWSPVTCKTGGARECEFCVSRTNWRHKALAQAVWVACVDSRPERRGLGQRPSNGPGRVGVSVSERNSQNALLSKASAIRK